MEGVLVFGENSDIHFPTQNGIVESKKNEDESWISNDKK